MDVLIACGITAVNPRMGNLGPTASRARPVRAGVLWMTGVLQPLEIPPRLPSRSIECIMGACMNLLTSLPRLETVPNLS